MVAKHFKRMAGARSSIATVATTTTAAMATAVLPAAAATAQQRPVRLVFQLWWLFKKGTNVSANDIDCRSCWYFELFYLRSFVRSGKARREHWMSLQTERTTRKTRMTTILIRSSTDVPPEPWDRSPLPRDETSATYSRPNNKNVAPPRPVGRSNPVGAEWLPRRAAMAVRKALSWLPCFKPIWRGIPICQRLVFLCCLWFLILMVAISVIAGSLEKDFFEGGAVLVLI